MSHPDQDRLYVGKGGGRYPLWCRGEPSKEFAEKFTQTDVAEMKKRQDEMSAERHRKYGHHNYREYR